MKQTYLILLLCVNHIFLKAEENKTFKDTVTVQIQYLSEEANEVYMAWGVNGWSNQEEVLWPEGTYRKDKILYTPMKHNNGVYTVTFKLKPNTLIDYAFWITKGPRDVASDIWDTNKEPQKDYHTLALSNHTTLIKSAINIRPKEQLSILNFSTPVFLAFLLLGTCVFFLKKYKFKSLAFTTTPKRIIICSAIILALALFMTRASVAKIGWDLYYNPLEYLPRLFWIGFYDYLYVIVITVLFLILLFAFKKHKRLQKTVAVSFSVVCFISLIASLLNIKVVEMLGKPFNFRWLYYSGFLKTTDSQAALSSNISAPYIISIVSLCVCAVLASVLLLYLLEWLLPKVKLRKVALTVFVCLNLGYLITAKNQLTEYKNDYNHLANPVTAFLESVNPLASDPELYSMEVPDSLRISDKKNSSELTTPFPKGIKNVLVVVLESTPAEYVQPYDSKYKITPELEKHLSHAVVFDNMYAHAPATNKSMVCLLGSVYPWLSYHSITYEHPDIAIPTISSELQKKGYRTAFFNSGDNRFLKAGEFLWNHKFEELKDCKSLNCKTQFIEKDAKWDPLDGTDDECAGDELMTWINSEKDKPFFSMIWTYQTHYPYYATGEEKNYEPADPILNRYLNAVNHSDYVLGKILNNLEKNGLFESTLVVVIGDHGEAFGRHDQTTHASKIYEENLHIPCVFINPGLKPQRVNGISGMIDISPTIMSSLGMQSPDQWQGENLFAATKNKRTYFYCPWSDYLFGYREGNKKYIFNASTGTTEIYDLEKDPQETKNIATSEEAELSHLKLAAWVQYHNNYMNSILAKK